MQKSAQCGKFGKKWKKIRTGDFADLGGLAVALLEFLAAAAGAGIVASHFGSGAHGLRCFSLGGAGLILKLLLLALLFAFDFFGLVFGASGLNQKKIADSFGVDASHQIFKQSEGFAFEFDERIFLSVAAQADSFFQ